MKFRKFLSLILAILMISSVPVYASEDAQTRIYLIEDFNYNSIADAVNAIGKPDVETYSPSTYADMKSYSDEQGKQILNGSTNAVTTSNSSLITGASGKDGDKALHLYSSNTGTSSVKTGYLYFVPDRIWTLTDNQKYVVSYDVKTKRVSGAKDTAVNNQFRVFNSKYTDGERTSQYRYRMHSIDNMKTTTQTVRWCVLPLGNNGAQTKVTFDNDTWYNVTTAFYDNGNGGIKKAFYSDGANYGGGSVVAGDGDTNAYNTIEAFDFSYSTHTQLVIDNLRIYTLNTDAGAFNVSTENTSNLPASTESITVKFSQPVAKGTFSAPSMTENGEAFTNFTVGELTLEGDTVGDEIYSSVKISFPNGLKAASEYKIIFPETVSNEIATPLGSYNNVTFTTQGSSDFTVKDFNIIYGYSTDEEKYETNFVADGTLQGAEISLKNNTSSDEKVSVLFAIYSSEGSLIDVVCANETIAAESTETVNTGLTVSETGTVKVFIWDSVTNLKPLANTVEKSIIAAQE